MKAEKQIIIDELLERINASPFLLVADYTGMNVPQFEELRNRLHAIGSTFQVAKNAFVKRALGDVEISDEITESLNGQTAIVTGESEVCATAKVLKNFHKEFQKPLVRSGVLDGVALDAAQIEALADLPPLEVLQAQFLGLLQTPARRLVTVLNEPAASLARLLQAKHDQGE